METRAAKRQRLYGLVSSWPSPMASSPEPPDSCPPAKTADDESSSSNQAQAAVNDPETPQFSLFTRLPAELRVEIWRHVEEQARQPLHPLRVRLYRGHERIQTTVSAKLTAEAKNKKKPPMYSTRLVPRLTAMPDLGPATQVRRALLRVCREARYEYLRRWSATLDLDRGGLVRFNPARDLVYLDIANRVLIDDLATLYGENPANLPPFVHAIQHLGLEMTPHLPQWLLMARDHMMPRLEFLLCFPHLRSLSLVNFGCFADEVTWSHAHEARLLLARSAGHSVHFRSFAVLPGFNYETRRTPRVGRQTSIGDHTRHDCAICSIHRCVYVRDMMRYHASDQVSDAEGRRLDKVKFHTLLAAVAPEVARHVQPLDAASLETGSDRQPGSSHKHWGAIGGGSHGGEDGHGEDDEDNANNVGEDMDDEMGWMDIEDDDDDDEDDEDDEGHGAFVGGVVYG